VSVSSCFLKELSGVPPNLETVFSDDTSEKTTTVNYLHLIKMIILIVKITIHLFTRIRFTTNTGHIIMHVYMMSKRVFAGLEGAKKKQAKGPVD
jgi:ascorbate-specific PTS system EIIC-type component UlaA